MNPFVPTMLLYLKYKCGRKLLICISRIKKVMGSLALSQLILPS